MRVSYPRLSLTKCGFPMPRSNSQDSELSTPVATRRHEYIHGACGLHLIFRTAELDVFSVFSVWLSDAALVVLLLSSGPAHLLVRPIVHGSKTSRPANNG